MLKVIKELCDSADLSYAELEDRTGIGRNSIYRWDKNSPSIDKVIKVAEYFNVSIDYLVGRSEKSERPDELNWCLNGMNEEGVEMVTAYANFILSQPQYKKYNFTKVVEKKSV